MTPQRTLLLVILVVVILVVTPSMMSMGSRHWGGVRGSGSQRRLARGGPAPLVYDLGFMNGHDTYSFLQQGYRVVAVEAVEKLYLDGASRFHREIAEGRLVLLNTLLVSNDRKLRAEDGEAFFWVSDGKPDWSSTSQDVACRRGNPCHSEKVPVTTCGELLTRYGPSLYAKLSLGGEDENCARSIAELTQDLFPNYISMPQGTLSMLQVLKQIGYEGYKLVCLKHFGDQSGPFGEYANNVLTLPDTQLTSYGFEWSTVQDLTRVYPYSDSGLVRKRLQWVHCWFQVHAKLNRSSFVLGPGEGGPQLQPGAV